MKSIFDGKLPVRLLTMLSVIYALGVILPSDVLAHQGDRVIPIYEITDDMLELIDLHDGNIWEWEDFFEPSLTTLDFTGYILDRKTLKRNIVAFDPSDLDFRMWLGWNGTHNRLFFSLQAVDNSHPLRERLHQTEDGVSLSVDGDHSGGSYRFFSGPRYRETMRTTQQYRAPYSWDLVTSVGLFNDPEGFEWINHLPYTDGGEGFVEGTPVFWVYEFFITPFDALVWKDEESSLLSELETGKVIGFYIWVGDVDIEETTIYEIDDRFIRGQGGNPWDNSDYFVDGVLLGAGEVLEDSAVRQSSWGLIKASLRQ